MKKTLFLIFMLAVAFIASSILIGVIVGLVMPNHNEHKALSTFIIYVGCFGSMIAYMYFFARTFSWKLPNLKPELGRANLTLVILALIGILATSLILEPLMQYVPEVGLDSLYDMMQGGIWTVITVVFAAPILEEIIFRGIIQTNATRFLGGNPFWGILVASVVFAAVHGVPQQMINVFFASLIIGGVYYLTNSLLTVIILHLLNNGLVYTLALYFGAEIDGIESSDFSSSTYWFIYAMCGLYLILTIRLLIIRINKVAKIRAKQNGITNTPQ